MALAEVKLWGSRIGAVRQDFPGDVAVFEYDPAFVQSGIEVAPLQMPLVSRQYRFPELSRSSFEGLPGMLADSLPDKFGNNLIDRYFAARGIGRGAFDSVERLCYVGARGMGALEFEPAAGPHGQDGHAIDVEQLRELATAIVDDRSEVKLDFDSPGAVRDILQVGTSAGGARAKAVIAWNPETNEVRSGQIDAGSGFQYWLLKFDGVSTDGRELGQGDGYGRIEYVYSRLARNAGVAISESRLFEEDGRSHFMTKRFDRTPTGAKLHMQTLGGLCHYDFAEAGAHSYEQVFLALRRLGLGAAEAEQQFRRMAFNIVARNQDDHVKNIAFLMDREGNWSPSPAYDLTYSYSRTGKWTATHQMTMNGKRDDFTLADFEACAESAILRRGTWHGILEDVFEAVRGWSDAASAAGVPERRVEQIRDTHRFSFRAA